MPAPTNLHHEVGHDPVGANRRGFFVPPAGEKGLRRAKKGLRRLGPRPQTPFRFVFGIKTVCCAVPQPVDGAWGLRPQPPEAPFSSQSALAARKMLNVDTAWSAGRCFGCIDQQGLIQPPSCRTSFHWRARKAIDYRAVMECACGVLLFSSCRSSCSWAQQAREAVKSWCFRRTSRSGCGSMADLSRLRSPPPRSTTSS